MRVNKRYALDLEFEQPCQTIIQIGAVAFNTDSGEIISEFCRYVRLGSPLSEYIEDLTGISDLVLDEEGVDFHTAYKDLFLWVRKLNLKREPVVWGCGDRLLLKHNLKKQRPEEKWHFGHRDLDVKALYQTYADAYGLSLKGGLETCMKRLKLSFDGKAHDAVVDARNTAKFYCFFVERFKN